MLLHRTLGIHTAVEVNLARRVTCNAAASAEQLETIVPAPPEDPLPTTQTIPSLPSSSLALLSPSTPDISNSDSDSDFEILTTLPIKQNMPMTTGASIIHTAYNHPPTVTEGELTPKIVMEFEQLCHTFFDNAKGGIPEEQRVARILSAFKDTLVCNWISSNRLKLIALSFDNFLAELCKKQLPRNWEDKVRTQILSDHLKVGTHFITWATRIQSLNCLLRDSMSHFSEQHLHKQIEAGIDEELQILGCEAKAQDADLMRDFLDTYELCDVKRKIAQKTF